MKACRRKYLAVIYLMGLYGLIGPMSILSDIGDIGPSEKEQKPPELTAALLYDNYEDITISMRDVLSTYYEGTEILQQEKAFRRVISWKKDFENIADKYPHVNWKMLSAIIKAETQGKTGRQESRAKAVGISQIKYQGAWAFLWDVLFRQDIKCDSGYVKDYYNANLRRRYKSQLQQIYHYLNENRIIVHPNGCSEEAYYRAKYVSWTNFKVHLWKKYKPGEYQVAVDIAAMYIDHIIMTFYNVKQHVMKIKEYVESNHFDRFNDIMLSGVTKIRWDSIKSKLLNQKGGLHFREITLDRLNYMQNRLEDPAIYAAAYNSGINNCLEYMESGMNLPDGISRYVKKVSTYQAIFNEFDTHKLYTYLCELKPSPHSILENNSHYAR